MKHTQYLLSLTAMGLMALPLSSNYWHSLKVNPERTIASEVILNEVSEADKLNHDLKMAQENIQELKNKLEHADKVILRNDEDCDRQEKQIAAIEEKIEAQKKIVSDLEAKIIKAEDDKLCKDEEIELLKKQLAEAQKEIDNSCSILDTLNLEISKMQNELKAKDEIIARKDKDLKNSIAIHDTYVCESEYKFSKLNNQIESFVKDQQSYLQMMVTMNQMMMMMMMNQMQQNTAINSSKVWGIQGMEHVYQTQAPLVLGQNSYSLPDYGMGQQSQTPVVNNYYGNTGFQQPQYNQGLGADSGILQNQGFNFGGDNVPQFGNFSTQL